jgi:hypothetical protein
MQQQCHELVGQSEEVDDHDETNNALSVTLLVEQIKEDFL